MFEMDVFTYLFIMLKTIYIW